MPDTTCPIAAEAPLPAAAPAPWVSAIPANPNTRLSRDALEAALNEAGFPITRATLATMVTRGGGPEFQLFGRRPLYVWSRALAWAEGKLSSPRTVTQAAAAPQAAAVPQEAA